MALGEPLNLRLFASIDVRIGQWFASAETIERVVRRIVTKVKGFPILKTSQDVLDHASFRRIEVSDVNVCVYIGIGWEVEHNRGVFIKNGKYAGYDVS